MKFECSQGYMGILTDRLKPCKFNLKAALSAGLGLVGLDEIADALPIALAMAMTGNRVAAAGGFNHNFGPENAGRNVHGGDLRNRDTFFVAAEEPPLHPRNPLRADHKFCGKEEVSLRPP